MPPRPSRAKLAAACSMLNVPVSAAATAKRTRTRPAASLSKLSPSRIAISLRGSATRSSTALAAMASGGETIAPSAKQTAQGRPGTIRWATTPTRKRGERNGTDSEKQDGAEIALELFPDREVGAVHEEWRQEYDNHQVRVKVNGRKTWH